MSDQKDSKLKALKLTLDKLDKTYGKGSVMRLGDQTVEKIESVSSGSIGLDIALGMGGYPKVGLLKYTDLNHQERRLLHYMQLLNVKKQVVLLLLLMLNMHLIDCMLKS